LATSSWSRIGAAPAAASALRRSRGQPPDGYTLLLAYSGSQVTNPALYSNLAWDAIKSFAPVALAITAPHVVLVRKGLPVSTLAEFVAYAKQNVGKIHYASSGLGSIQNIGAEQLSLVSAVYAPAGTPQPVIARLAGVTESIVKAPRRRGQRNHMFKVG
jgi:tripartite-type tricarboxylate transporter receptor subunit TctC